MSGCASVVGQREAADLASSSVETETSNFVDDVLVAALHDGAVGAEL